MLVNISFYIVQRVYLRLRNLGFISRHKAGINTKALTRQKSNEIFIRIANERIIGKTDTKSMEKPIITEKALIIIPRPIVFKVLVILCT